MYFDKLHNLGIKLSRRSGNEKTFCPQCHDGRKNKRDRSLSVNITTGEYKCHNTGCDFKGNVRSDERKRGIKKYQKPPQDVLKSIEIKEKVERWMKSRGISRGTMDKFHIFCKEELMPQTGKKESCICFPYIRDGQIVNIKYRDGAKNFRMVKDAELILFNLQSIGDKKYCIITEGEIDAMSVYEVGFGVDAVSDEQGVLQNEEFSKWCVLSVPNGASTGNQKLDYLDSCAEWLMDIEEFILATDGDRAGFELQQELVRRIGVERCKLISYPLEECVPTGEGLDRRCKDLNEVLMFLGKEAVINVLNNSEYIPIEGIHYVDDIFPQMLENFRKGIQPSPPTHFGEMDEFFRWKKGEINLFVGYANYGKSFFVTQLMLTKSVRDGWKWAIFSPENYPATDFYDDLIEMYVGKWLDKMNEDEYSAAAKFIDEHIYYVYPTDGHDIHSIDEKFRYLVLKKGIDGVLLDPWNQLDHVQKPYQREDQYLSESLKDVKRFALLNCISYNIVAHPVKPSKLQDQSLPPVDMYDISGGSMWANKGDNIISYHRPNHHTDKNSTDVKIYIQKIKRKRTGGKPGEFDLKLNWETKRFVDPISKLPFLNLYYKYDPKLPKEERETRKPYSDNDTELPF